MVGTEGNDSSCGELRDSIREGGNAIGAKRGEVAWDYLDSAMVSFLVMIRP